MLSDAELDMARAVVAAAGKQRKSKAARKSAAVARAILAAAAPPELAETEEELPFVPDDAYYNDPAEDEPGAGALAELEAEGAWNFGGE